MVYINIGTNLGDRHSNLRHALEGVAARYNIAALSDIVESEPWGFESANCFLNICAAFETADTPLQVLDAMQQIERSISPASHRNPDGSYADRLIDIDIVYIDGVQLNTPRLTLPHPHLEDRDFFINPFRQVQSRLKQVDGQSIEQHQMPLGD